MSSISPNLLYLAGFILFIYLFCEVYRFIYLFADARHSLPFHYMSIEPINSPYFMVYYNKYPTPIQQIYDQRKFYKIAYLMVFCFNKLIRFSSFILIYFAMYFQLVILYFTYKIKIWFKFVIYVSINACNNIILCMSSSDMIISHYLIYC